MTTLPQEGWVEVRVSSGVFAEMVGTHESLLTDWTHEILLPCVGSGVSGKFIAASKSLAAGNPRALERPFSCVCSQMSR